MIRRVCLTSTLACSKEIPQAASHLGMGRRPIEPKGRISFMMWRMRSMSRSLAIVFAAAFILECHPAPQAVQTHVQSSTGTAEQASAKPQFTEKAIDPATAYRTKVPASFVGTYLPLTYIRNLKTTGSHILSLRAAVTDGNYPVLALS